MSAIGLATPQFVDKARFISAHADYRRSDFVFPRTQSNAMRDLPWDGRMKPMRCWCELTTYAAAGFVGAVVAMAMI